MLRMQVVVGMAGLVLAATLAGALSLAAGGEKKEVIANGGVASSLLAAPVIGQPYSAMVVHHESQRLQDGTNVSHAGHHFAARDSAGRVRVERRMEKGKNGEPDTVLVFVSDPVAHTFTTWVAGPNVQNKIASVVKMPAERKQELVVEPQTASASKGPLQPVSTTENLGMVTLQGLPVTDVRTTTVVPVGHAGNDAPITKTREIWTSPDLKLAMKQRSEDPRTGVVTVELEEFSRAEPDPALFRAPKGYTVKSALESLKEMEAKLEAMQN